MHLQHKFHLLCNDNVFFHLSNRSLHTQNALLYHCMSLDTLFRLRQQIQSYPLMCHLQMHHHHDSNMIPVDFLHLLHSQCYMA